MGGVFMNHFTYKLILIPNFVHTIIISSIIDLYHHLEYFVIK